MQAVAEAGRVDILINNAGIIRRNDALSFIAAASSVPGRLQTSPQFSCHKSPQGFPLIASRRAAEHSFDAVAPAVWADLSHVRREFAREYVVHATVTGSSTTAVGR